MGDRMKISVIMGIYNCEKYLEDAIDCIFAQTYKDWELIMCDDGSNDQTYSIAKEYEKKYPNPEYIFLDSCFRVDIPEDYFKNYTKEFSDYNRVGFYEYAHTKENIVKVLQKFNKDIDDIELTDERYIEKFCEENGFFRLYDSRLKHEYKPIKIEWTDLDKDGYTRVKFLYTCYSADGLKYQEEQQSIRKTQDLINDYGKDLMSNLMTKYVEEKCKNIDNQKIIESFIEDKNKLFEEEKNIDLADEVDIDY